jgi:hypothetical protein
MYTLIVAVPDTNTVKQFADIPAKHVAQLTQAILDAYKADTVIVVDQQAAQPAAH